MNIRIVTSFSVLLLLLYAYDALAQYTPSRIDTFAQPPMSVTIEVIKEDIEKGVYVISWKDTVAQAAGESKSERGTELHCFVYDANALVGYYSGMSTSFTHCGFATRDTLVDVIFSVRSSQAALSKFEMCDQSEFHKITVNLNQTKNRIVILQNNTNIVKLYSSFDASEPLPPYIPCIGCCDYDEVICRTRFYLDANSGKIRTGEQWLNNNTIDRIIYDLDLVLINPYLKYSGKEQRVYTGHQLIAKKKLSNDEFDFESIKQQAKDFPY